MFILFVSCLSLVISILAFVFIFVVAYRSDEFIEQQIKVNDSFNRFNRFQDKINSDTYFAIISLLERDEQLKKKVNKLIKEFK